MGKSSSSASAQKPSYSGSCHALPCGRRGDGDRDGAQLLHDAPGLDDQAFDVVLVGDDAGDLELGGVGLGKVVGPVVVGPGAGPEEALVGALEDEAHGGGEVVDHDLLVPTIAVHVDDAALSGELGLPGPCVLGGHEVAGRAVDRAPSCASGALGVDTMADGAFGEELAGEEEIAAQAALALLPGRDQGTPVVELRLDVVAPQVVGLLDVGVCVDDLVAVQHGGPPVWLALGALYGVAAGASRRAAKRHCRYC